MNEWFQTPLGQSVLRMEMEKCADILPVGYYPHSLQVGFPWLDFMPGLDNRCKIVVDVCSQRQSLQVLPAGPGLRVVSRVSALPFPEKSMDLVVLPHTLDFCKNPHAVLREVNALLVAEGCIVIVGFNAASLYGIMRLLKRGNRLPFSGRYYRVARVQDWLSLLGYDIVGAAMLNYQPPLQSVDWRRRLAFMDLVGARWFPGLGGVYAIVGKKRVMGATPKLAEGKTWRQLFPAIPQTASQRAARVGIRLVKG